MPRALLILTCLIASAWAAAPAQAEVRRCVDARGVAVYTDRPCETMQAAPREAPPDPSAGANITTGFAVRGCARRPETLLNGVRSALEARDVNRLANWYHWTGTGSGTAKSLMDELEAIANRPLVSAELVYPETRYGFPSETGVGVESPAVPSTGDASGNPTLTPSPATTTAEPGPEPVSLLVQQMRGPADIESVSVRFALRQNAGCWWIEL